MSIFRIICLTLYMIITELVDAVSCVKPDDLNSQTISLGPITKSILTDVNVIIKQYPNFNTDEKAVITELIGNLNSDLNQ